MANNIDWTKNLTKDPAYGAVPTVTINDNTGFGYTVGGLNGATGSNTMWSTNTTATGSFTIAPNYSAVGSQLEQSGKMSLRGQNADLDINGKSLKHWMERVEERLNILTPNPELEKEWDDLRRLGERYRSLEKKCQEKARMWEALKKVQPKQP